MVFTSEINPEESKSQEEKQQNELIQKPLESALFQISKIMDHLYLSGACVLEAERITQLGVTCVVNCSMKEELPDLPLPDIVTQYHRILVPDCSATDLFKYFHIIADLINEVGGSNGKILVHCVAGVSRSASLCLAYLIKYYHMTLESAFKYLSQCRPCIRPNSGFVSQLIEFEKEFHSSPSVNMIYDELTQKYIPDIYQNKYPKLCCLMGICQKRTCVIR